MWIRCILRTIQKWKSMIKFADRQNDWCTKLCRTDVDQLFSFFARKKNAIVDVRGLRSRQRSSGKKAICKWHVIHYTRLHNSFSLVNGISSWQKPYHMQSDVFDAWLCRSVWHSITTHRQSPSVTVSHRHSPSRTHSYMPFAITSQRFDSVVVWLQNVWK